MYEARQHKTNVPKQMNVGGKVQQKPFSATAFKSF